jgi:hypothetical protein
MRRHLPVFAAVVIIGLAPALAQQTRTRTGTLVCDVSAGVGLILGSQREIACSFTPTSGSASETYIGRITRFGLDIGVTGGGELVWAVFAPTDRFSPAQLAGTYVGAGAEATAGLGLGANVLLGGSQDTVALQPLSIQGQTGVNLAVGVTGIEIARAVRR